MIRRPILICAFGLAATLVSAVPAFAASPATITFRHKHFIVKINPTEHPQWRRPVTSWSLNGQEIDPPAEWRVDGDVLPPLPAGVALETRVDWNRSAIRRSLEINLSSLLDRPAGSVTIKKDEKGNVIFDGIGFTGREVDLDRVTTLTIMALEEGIDTIEIPVTETPATVTVLDSDLQSQGIKEVVTIGESVFKGSPINRQHNITVGLKRFNGHLIPRGSTFSFVEVLGRVDGSTGYRKELVIKGDKTEPDYGGGLCQVSTTAYRGVWEYGFPIVARRNHSYAVSYYGPQGSDATVYPGSADMKFLNDSPGALLMQTYQEDQHAYFIYYGTKDERRSEVWGPLILSTKTAPPDRTVYTSELPPGEKRKVGDRHPGMTALWYRFRTTAAGEEKMEPVLSVYEARPLYYEVGADPNAVPTGSAIDTPEPPRIF